MRVHATTGLLLCLLTGSGCQTTPESAAEPAAAASVAAGNVEAQLERGKNLLASGYYIEAIKQFAYLRDHAASIADRDRASFGLSMALNNSGNSGAALGALQPLPVLPTTAIEARKCILAGEIYLHQQKFEQAGMWLARGLAVEEESQESYRATGFFNVGKACLGLDELEEARTAFAMAKEIFLANGDQDSAGECDLIIADIDHSLM